MGSDSSKLEPQVLEDLKRQTFLEEDEIIDWYKQFLRDHPSGHLTINEFQKEYKEVFPNGDASKFAEHIFRTFDHDQSGEIDFKEFVCALSITRRGTPNQKLKWAFNLYDTNRDGFITKKEMYEIVKAIEKMAGPECGLSKSKVKDAFLSLDTDNDGKLTLAEFIAGAEKHPDIVNMLQATASSDES